MCLWAPHRYHQIYAKNHHQLEWATRGQRVSEHSFTDLLKECSLTRTVSWRWRIPNFNCNNTRNKQKTKIISIKVLTSVMWITLNSTILCSWADSLHLLYIILNEWLAFYSAFLNIHRSGVLKCCLLWTYCELTTKIKWRPRALLTLL